MTAKWRNFEKESVIFLKNKFPKIVIQELGDSDSTVTDLKINNSFFVEIKSPLSQAGQFVIEEKNGFWVFGNGNKSIPTKNSELIIKKINSLEKQNFHTSGHTLDIKKDIQIGWIKDFYKQRKVDFFITEYGGEKIIVSIENIDKIFDINCTIRRKKSGSSEVSNKLWHEIKEDKIFKHMKKNQRIDGKLYVEYSNIPHDLTSTITKKDVILKEDYHRIQFKKTQENDNVFYLRKLSKTANPTVIFTLNTIRGQDNKDFIKFENKYRRTLKQ